MTNQQTQTLPDMHSFSKEEQQFIQKATNAGLAISFTPQGMNEPVTFFPSASQIENATQQRSLSENPQQGLSYTFLLEQKKSNSSIAVISNEESEQIPYMPNIRSSFFSTLPLDTKAFVLKANLSGLNVTAKGTNGKSFLYLAPQNDQAREIMRQELATLTSKSQNILAGTQKVATDSQVSQQPLLNTNQYQ